MTSEQEIQELHSLIRAYRAWAIEMYNDGDCIVTVFSNAMRDLDATAKQLGVTSIEPKEGDYHL